MGKKDRNGTGKKRSKDYAAAPGSAAGQAQDSGSDEEADYELEREMAVLEAIRAEKAALVSKTGNKEGAAGEGEGAGAGGANNNRQRGMYNKDGLEQALASRTELPFLESYEICEFELEVTDENDDLAREMAFYNQSMAAVVTGRDRLKKLGVPLRRPDDYFAENIKSDAHMMRIKDKLLLETKKMDAFEKRQQKETNRKYNKQLQEMKKKERADKEKGEIKGFQSLRKGAGNGRGDDGEDGDVSDRVEKMLKGGAGGGRGVGERGKGEKSLKRKNMDKKYGAGVKDKMRNKLNDKKSYNDMSDYSPRGGKFIRRDKGSGKPGGGGGKGGGGKSGGKGGKPGGGGKGGAYKAASGKSGKAGAGSNRPGKSKRDAQRGGKR